MEVLCLGEQCILVRVFGVSILVDCGLELSSWMRLTRESESESEGSSLKIGSPAFHAIDMASVDVLLLSNHKSLLALPLITEYSSFRGQVFATEPTLHFGRCMMEELATSLNASEVVKGEMAFREGERKSSSVKASSCSSMAPYDMYDIAASIARVQPLSYGESVPISANLRAAAASSCFSIGSANWVIQTPYEKFGIMSTTSAAFRRHPSSLDTSALSGSSILLMSDLRPPQFHGPGAMLLNICSQLEPTLKQAGNVLMPVSPCGVIFDLFEYFNTFLHSKGLGHIPIFFVSPVAETSIAYSGIVAEWLCAVKQNLAFEAKHPFIHDELIQNNRLRVFKSVQDEAFVQEYREPCILMTGHSSMRSGDVSFFLQRWQNDARNLLVITEPEVCGTAAVSTLAEPDFRMRVVECPIDPRLSLEEAGKVVQQVAPARVLLPNRFDPAEVAAQGILSPIMYSVLEPIRVPVQGRYERAFMEPSLARELKINPIHGVEGGVAASSIQANLSCVGDLVTIESLSPIEYSKLRKDKSSILLGNPSVTSIVNALERRGISDVTLGKCVPDDLCAEDAVETILEIPSLSAKVSLRPCHTGIITDLESSRQIIMSAIIGLLHCIS